jgi:anti-sigma B factor antagonist
MTMEKEVAVPKDLNDIDTSRLLLRIMVSQTEGRTLMVLDGELDDSTAGRLRERASKALENLKGNLVLDIERLTFLDAAGLSTILTLHKRLSAQGSNLVIHSPSRMARRMFEITGLTSVLWIEPVKNPKSRA